VKGTAARTGRRSLPSKLWYGGQLLWRLCRNPIENGAQFYERRVSARGWSPDTAYPVDERWEAKFHELIEARWPCSETESFDRSWEAALGELAGRGLVVGREAFGGWDDGDRALVRVAWCLVRHLAPEHVVETGVGRGLTSRTVLEGLEANGNGHLWSVDQPPPLSPALSRQTGIAVPERLRPRWTYVRGTSRRRLPEIVAEVGSIDLFIHDSMHTTRNVEFELERIWPALRDGGAMLVDDVDMNRAFERFVPRHGEDLRRLIAISDDGLRRFGLIARPKAVS
jgi:Methyltransferase domain